MGKEEVMFLVEIIQMACLVFIAIQKFFEEK
jgi:hypothetical protein